MSATTVYAARFYLNWSRPRQLYTCFFVVLPHSRALFCIFRLLTQRHKPPRRQVLDVLPRERLSILPMHGFLTLCCQQCAQGRGLSVFAFSNGCHHYYCHYLYDFVFTCFYDLVCCLYFYTCHYCIFYTTAIMKDWF